MRDILLWVNLTSSPEQGTILLESGSIKAGIDVFGSSVTLGPGLRMDGRSVLVIPNQNGLIALGTPGAPSSHRNAGFFRVFHDKDGKGPWLDKEVWLPSAGRPGLVDPNFGISVQIGDEVFVQNTHHPICKTANCRLVTDGDLLCRYLIGEAGAEEVRASAEEMVRELQVIESLRRENRELKDSLKERESLRQKQFEEAHEEIARISREKLAVRSHFRSHFFAYASLWFFQRAEKKRILREADKLF